MSGATNSSSSVDKTTYDIIVAFVLAESINVWACLNPIPDDLDGKSLERLHKTEIASSGFIACFGLYGSFRTKSYVPFVAAITFCIVMYFVYEELWQAQNGGKIDAARTDDGTANTITRESAS